MLNFFWSDHPEIIYVQEVDDGMNWTKNLFSGVEVARKKGFDAVYLINEEHVPIGICDNEYLSKTLPYQAQSIGACYVSLFGWDNKRFCSKSPRLAADSGAWMQLTAPNDPRFHLHPAWWRVDVLAECCGLVLRDGRKNGSAWQFEKICAYQNASISNRFRDSCYQVCAGLSRGKPISKNDMRRRLFGRWFSNKAMAMVPYLNMGFLQSSWLKFWDFDAVVSDGAYPMVFSGVLAKGKFNPIFMKALEGAPEGLKWKKRILEARGRCG